MSAVAACAICGGEARPDVRTPRVAVVRCRACGHRAAEHRDPGAAGDYHLQYDQGAFLEALRVTRRRQARDILALVRAELPGVSSVLDYGCGRGWFLDELRDAGVQRLAGADTSPLAVDGLAQRGFDAVLAPEDPRAAPLEAPFRPEVVTLLDVLEHFPPAAAVPALRALLVSLRPSLVVVKVPVASGLLYRTAVALARAGVHGPLEQLFQAGTSPPHRSYFTRTSLRAALLAAGVRVVAEAGDRDFEPESLAERARPLSRLPRPLARLAGGAAALAVARLGMEDSLVAVARVDG